MGIFGEITRVLREQGMSSEGMAQTRKLGGVYAAMMKAVAASFSLFYLYTTYFGLVSQETHVGFYYLGTFILCFMLYKGGKKSPEDRISILDALFIVGMIVTIVYYVVEFPTLADRLGGVTATRDIIFGWFLIIMSLEMARRTSGTVIPMIGVVLLIYAYFGPYFPLGLGHSGFSLARIAESLFLTGDGILGMICNIFASYILIFVILGAFMEVSGCGKAFVDLAYAITGKRTGGPGLASVFTSALFGTVSGSAVANVVVDGVFTIPLMKRIGYPAHFAAAVEAATSTGGQYMPPVMGAAAFLLAEISGTPYVEVIKIAAIPACLYFASTGVIIYLEALKRGLKGMPASELPQIRESAEIHPPPPSHPDSHCSLGPGHHSLHRRFLCHLRYDHRQLGQEGNADGPEEISKPWSRGPVHRSPLGPPWASSASSSGSPTSPGWPTIFNNSSSTCPGGTFSC